MKKPNVSKKGSILIWTVLLGTLLSTAFLFFILRFGDGRAFRQVIMEQSNQKQYLESFMGYLKSLSASQLETHKGQAVSFFGDEITGSLDNETHIIAGMLDIGEQATFSQINDEVVIFWNLCQLEESGDLQTNQGNAPFTNQCGPAGVDYNNFLTAAISSELTLELTALNAPLHYAIQSTTPGNVLPGNKWLSELQVRLPYGRKVEMIENFTPDS